MAAFFAFLLFPTFSKSSNVHAAVGCTYTPNTVAVGGQIIVTSVDGLAGEIRTAGAFWPQLPTGTDTGSVLLGNLTTTSPLTATVSGTSSGSSPLSITAGLYAVRGPFGILCTTTGGGTGLSVTGGGGGGGTCALGSSTVAAGSNLGFGYNNFAGGQKIFIWDGGAKRYDLGTTATGPQLVSLPIPATVPLGSYGGFIENAGFPSSPCGPVTVTADDGSDGGGRVSTPTCNGFLDCIGILGGTNKFSADNLIGGIFNSILPVILGIAGMISVVMIFISGFQFATSSGNPEAAASARGRLTYALIGFAIATFAFALTQIIDFIFLNKSGII